jgi:hypothetical protein
MTFSSGSFVRSKTAVAVGLALGAVFSLSLMVACGAILGIEPPIDPPPDGSINDTGAAEASTDDAGAGDAADEAEAEPPCVHTDPETIDAVAIYVAPATGEDSDNCGDRTKPCKTIAFSQQRATVFGRTRILLSRGVYRESVTLSAGMTLEGGWDILGTDWIRTCLEPRNRAAVIQAPNNANTTITATNVATEATLRTLTIRSKDTARAGESLYGLVSHGATTKVLLDDVSVDVARGGDGAVGVVGPVGSAPAAAGSCPVADGGRGTDGLIGPGADGGTFGPTGYVPSSGGKGSLGTGGLGGTTPGTPPCVDCFTCTGVLLGCNSDPAPQNCGGVGKTGCGGGPGGGGEPGGGGGASIGLYVWEGQVTCRASSIHAGAGGAGGAGGPGGGGAFGSSGAVGPTTGTCNTACNGDLGGCHPTEAGANGGPAGGTGGRGGMGGQGGGGPGGPSYAIVRGATGVVNATDTTLAHGDAGASLGNGSRGTAGDQFP